MAAPPLLLVLPLLVLCSGLTAALAARTPCRCPLEMQPNVCGSDGNTYLSRCDLDCAKMSTPGLTLWRDGPCGYVPGELVAAGGGALRLEELSGCLMRCLYDYDACLQASCRYGLHDESDAECLQACAQNMTTCTCSCRQPAAVGPAGQPTTTTASPRPDVRWNAQQMLRRWRQGAGRDRGLTRATGTASSAAPPMYQCVEEAGEALAKCMWDCEPDNKCVVACSHRSLDAMCRCSNGAAPGTALAVHVGVAAAVVTWVTSWARAG